MWFWHGHEADRVQILIYADSAVLVFIPSYRMEERDL